MNIDDYLAKIGCEDAKTPVSLENLEKIRTGHVRTFSFENFDMHMTGKRIEFGLENAYDRFMKQSRGGFCIQMNFMLGWALRQLGYELYFVSAYFFLSPFDIYKYWPVHCALIVSLTKNNQSTLYYVDVGTSRFISQAIEFALDKVQETRMGVFRFVKDDEHEEGSVLLQRSKCVKSEIELDFANMFRFNVFERKEMEDFREMNDYVQTEKHPSLFYRTVLVKHTENGIIMLIGWKFSEINFSGEFGETRFDRVIEDIEEIRDIIRNKFRLVIEDAFRPVDKLSM